MSEFRGLGLCDVCVGGELHAVAEAQELLTGTRPRCGAALHRCGQQLGQERIVFAEPVRLVGETFPLEDAGHTADDASQDSVQFFRLRRRGWMEPKFSVVL